MSAHVRPSLDSFKCRRTLDVDGKAYEYFSLPEAEKNGLDGISAAALFAQGLCLKTCCATKTGRQLRRTTSGHVQIG